MFSKQSNNSMPNSNDRVCGSATRNSFCIALTCFSLLAFPVLADDADWQTIDSGSSHNSSSDANTQGVNNEWVNVPSAEGTAPNEQNVHYDLKSILNSLDEHDQAGMHAPLVEPSIIEFRPEGSAVQVQETPLVEELETREPTTEDLTTHRNLDMFVGELKVMGKVDVTRVAIGNGSIIRAEVLKTGELLVIGQAAGSTSLRLWNKDLTQSDYNIRVSENDLETRVHMERMVRMRVRMVEFRKSALGQLGIDWGSSAAGPTFAAAGDAIGNNLFRPAAEGFTGLPNTVDPFSTYFGIATNITSKIDFLAQNGDAITLAEPVLSAINGGSASFLAGGEVPFPTTGENGQAVVDFKEYGIKLNVSPQIDSSGNVRTSIETEISQLDSAVAINGTPGLLTRRAQTQFNVRSGETIVISGLLNAESSDDINYIPGIGRLPVIGKLFSSTNKRNSVTELVVFVTPEVVEPGQQLNTVRENQQYEQTTTRMNDARDQLPLME